MNKVDKNDNIKVNVRRAGDYMTMLTYNFSAIRGKQWGKDFYSFMCPLNIVTRLFKCEDEMIPETIIKKRVVDEDLINELTDKIVSRKATYFIEPIMASIDAPINFKVLDDQYVEIGVISFPMVSARFIVNGYEEKMAIERAMKIDPKLRNSVLSVIVYPDPGFVMAEEIIENKIIIKSAVKEVMEVDEFEAFTAQLMDKYEFIRKRIDLNNKSLGKYSKKLFLKKQITQGTHVLIGDEPLEAWYELVDGFWVDYFSRIELFKDYNGFELRTDYVIDYGTVLEGMALAVRELHLAGDYDAEKFFRIINSIDWSRKNHDWKRNILTDSGRVIKNNDVISYVKNKVKNEYSKEHNNVLQLNAKRVAR